MTTAPVRVAVDAMGGDHAPGRVVDGAVAAARQGVAVTLVGRDAEVRAALAAHPDADALDLVLVDAAEVVGMDEAPAMALRRKPDASIRVAASVVARGEAHALVSAGHTGATVVAAHAVFGMLPGVDRPALAPAIPTRTGMAVLLDAGATVECRPQHLLQFGVMGSVYAEALLGTPRPRVGVLSIGEEEGKGNMLIKEALPLLQASGLNFIGNIEPKEFMRGAADVALTDGFTGNIMMKTAEAIASYMSDLIRDELMANPFTAVGGLLAKSAFGRVRRLLDPHEVGGAPLLGVNGVVIIGHGRSNAYAIKQAVGQARRMVAHNIVLAITTGVANSKLAE